MCVKSEFPNVSLFVDDFLIIFFGLGWVVSILCVLSGQLSLSEGGSFDHYYVGS